MRLDTLERLREIPMFSGLDQAGLERVAAIATEFEAPKGQVLIEKGQAGTGLFIIEEGTARVELAGGGRLEHGPGSFFGELAVLADTPRNARVMVASDMRGLAIRRNDLIQLLESNPSMAIAMLREVARRLAETGQQV